MVQLRNEVDKPVKGWDLLSYAHFPGITLCLAPANKRPKLLWVGSSGLVMAEKLLLNTTSEP